MLNVFSITMVLSLYYVGYPSLKNSWVFNWPSANVRSTCIFVRTSIFPCARLRRGITKRHGRHKAVLQGHWLGGLSLNDAEVDLLVINAASSVVTSNLNLVENIFRNGAARGEAEISSSTIQDCAVVFGRQEEVDLLLTLQARFETELAALQILTSNDGPVILARVGEGVGPGHVEQFSRAVCSASDFTAINGLGLVGLVDKALGVDLDTASCGGFEGRSCQDFRRIIATDVIRLIGVVVNDWDHGGLGRNDRSYCSYRRNG